MNSVGSSHSHARSMSIVSLELPRNLIVSIDDNFRVTRNNSATSLALLAGEEEARRKNYSAILLDDDSETEVPKRARHRLNHLKKDFELRWKNMDAKMKLDPPKHSPLEAPRPVSPFASKQPAPLVSHLKPLSPYPGYVKLQPPYVGSKTALNYASSDQNSAKPDSSYEGENASFSPPNAIRLLFDAKEVKTTVPGAPQLGHAKIAHPKPILVPHLRTDKRAIEPLPVETTAAKSNPTSPTLAPVQYLKKTRALASKNLPLYIKKKMIFSKDLQFELLGSPGALKMDSTVLEALACRSPKRLGPPDLETAPLNTLQQTKLISQLNKKWNTTVTSKAYTDGEVAPPRPRKRSRRDLMYSDEEPISEVEDTSFNETPKDPKSTT